VSLLILIPAAGFFVAVIILVCVHIKNFLSGLTTIERYGRGGTGI
jgi:hypothetical protein